MIKRLATISMISLLSACYEVNKKQDEKTCDEIAINFLNNNNVKHEALALEFDGFEFDFYLRQSAYELFEKFNPDLDQYVADDKFVCKFIRDKNALYLSGIIYFKSLETEPRLNEFEVVLVKIQDEAERPVISENVTTLWKKPISQ